ncbi:MAG: efflux RND transporter permease subunit [Candidatus Loosdrechtia sp.]|uniref:efflux RND transporter permease subunit n=1 Tax=Candidatus Loosdrechtia sp. TaxID=3101272 RepID=UPI003A71EFAD|nr:MAG: CusA/CzcA family heavy metal efflux RND transporter [Candidatus Jettenia sp. AMX2]
MINNLIGYALKQVFLVIIALCVIIGIGIYYTNRLPIDAIPDVTTNQVQINTEVSGLGPVEVEKLITFPIEFSMSSLPDVAEVRSLSKTGLSQVTVTFNDHVNIYFARQLVLERLQEAKEQLPQVLMAQPTMGPISTGLGEIYQYIVTGVDKDNMELRTIQDWMIRPRLLTTPGVIEVNSFGGFVKQYQVIVDPGKLISYNITLREVFDALAVNNANAGGQYIEHASEQYLIRGIGLVTSLQDIEDIVVHATEEGTPVYIKNLADVKLGPEVRYGAVTKDGKGEVVTGIAMMLKGENSRTVAGMIKQKIEDIKLSLPKGVSIIPFYDRTDLVNNVIHTVFANLTSGIILVVGILFLFLGNWRGALLVAFSIPLTGLLTFSGMYQLGIAATVMSLGALDFGMVIDGSVVMVENIIRRIARKDSGKPTTGKGNHYRETISLAAQEVGRPIFFAVSIIIIVYLPILTLQGIEGKMFKPMAFTVCLAMLSSLLITLFIMPPLCSVIFRKGIQERSYEGEIDNRIMRFLKRRYQPLLHKAISRPKITITAAATCFAGSLLFIPFLGSEFIPELDEGAIAINVVRLPSISLTESLENCTFIEKVLMKYPEVETVISKTGRAEIATDPMGQETSDIFVMLKPKKTWQTAKTKEDLTTLMREDLERIPGIQFSFSQPIELRISELVAGVRSDIAVKLFGEDFEVLKPKAKEIERVIASIRGSRDTKTEQVGGLFVVEIRINRSAIARYGINVSDIQEVITTAIGGKVASQVLEGQMRFDLVVRFAEEARSNIEEIRNILINTPGGSRVPLSQLADISLEEGPAQINRENGHRRIVVECNVRGRDIGSFVAEAQKMIREKVEIPAGYYLEWGGQFENMQRATKRLALVVPIAMSLIFILLYINFQSLRNAALIYINVPFAATGGIVALFLRDMHFSISAGIGFIALFGLCVLNGTVMVSYINELRQNGKEMENAVTEGALTRLRPVLMTVTTDIIGFLPMAVSTSIGAEVQKPLATVVIGGLCFSTLLTLFVVPALYQWFPKRIEENVLCLE